MIRAEREYYVTFIVATIAVLFIVGGFASFTGLSVQDEAISIAMAKESFRPSDVFDVTLILNPVTFMADESIIIYIDSNAVGAVAIKKYLDDNGIEYGREVKDAGQNSIQVINLRDRLMINLADHVQLEYMRPGTKHILRAEFSRGDAAADAVFNVE